MTKVSEIQTIGWREWLCLPSFAIKKIKAKIDTGARTSSLHAFDIEEFKKGKKTFVRFSIHPHQKDNLRSVHCQAELIEKRKVKDSGGKITLRPVIITKARLGSTEWDIEVTLTSRDEMGFRMLLGRQAVRGLFMINPARSFLFKKIKGK